MNGFVVALVLVAVAFILMGWAIGHFGTSRRRRTAPSVTTTQPQSPVTAVPEEAERS